MSKFVKDPANPTDREIVAAIDRSMAAGLMIPAEQFFAQARAAEDACGNCHLTAWLTSMPQRDRMTPQAPLTASQWGAAMWMGAV